MANLNNVPDSYGIHWKIGHTLPLIGTGLLFGFLHVISSPDHLSALSTISANIGNCKAFTYGIRWGIGHSLGLIIVAAILISISTGNDIEMSPLVDNILESLVGIFMILLGFWGFYIALKRRNVQLRERVGDEKSSKWVNEKTTLLDEETGRCNLKCPAEDLEGNLGVSSENIRTNKCIPLAIGILHGVAGQGGVLGVIPAVQLRSAYLAMLYLGSFCISLTFTMGIYAGFYGNCSERISSGSNVEFGMNLFSASLSLIVGVLWLVLLSFGILDEVFP